MRADESEGSTDSIEIQRSVPAIVWNRSGKGSYAYMQLREFVFSVDYTPMLVCIRVCAYDGTCTNPPYSWHFDLERSRSKCGFAMAMVIPGTATAASTYDAFHFINPSYDTIFLRRRRQGVRENERRGRFFACIQVPFGWRNIVPLESHSKTWFLALVTPERQPTHK